VTRPTVTFDDLLDIRKNAEGNVVAVEGVASRIGKVVSVEEWEVKAQALRDLFRQTLGLQPAEIECPLLPKVVAETDRGDYIQRKIAYSLAPDERVSSYALIPKKLAGRAPAILCPHPTRATGKESVIGNDDTPEREACSCALHLVRRGYVSFAYDLAGFGERVFKGAEVFDTAPFYKKYPHWSVVGDDLWTTSRAIDALEVMDEVDSRRIGSIGYSQGGYVTLTAMALNPRIKAGVSSCGYWPARLSKNPFHHARTAGSVGLPGQDMWPWRAFDDARYGGWIGRPSMRPYCLMGKDFPIDMHEILALIAPRPIMNISSLSDVCAKYTAEEEALTRPVFESLAKNVAKVFALYGAESNFRNVLHTKGHGFEEEHRKIAYAFLDEMLKSLT